MDRELEAFNQRLFEFPINFPPSYPFEEQTKDAERYMPTRCPAWCDRVVFSENAQKLVHNVRLIFDLIIVTTTILIELQV